MQTNSEIQIYTGSCWEHNLGRRSRAKRRCGWGFVAYDEEKIISEQSGGEYAATCNRMELTAAIKAMELFGNKRVCLRIHSSQTYLVNGASKFLKDWKVKGWKGANKQEIKNLDLWMKIDHLTQRHSVTWSWVKIDSGNVGNNRAYQLANVGILSLE